MRRTRVEFWACLVVAIQLSACSSGETDVTVSGTVQYDAYRSGPISIKLVEDSTEDCGLTSCSSKTPGDTKARTRLDKPGAFTMRASVQGKTMHLMGYALGDADVDWECEAGAAQSLDVADHRDVLLVLASGICPALH